MLAIKLQGLSISEAEEAIAEVWSCLEKYSIPSPRLKATRANKRITIELSGFDEPLWTKLVDASLLHWRCSKMERTRITHAKKIPTEHDREGARLLGMERAETLTVPRMDEVPLGAIAEMSKKTKRRFV
jgi:hypothetical protein